MYVDGDALQSKSVDWFLYDNGLRHERVNLPFQQIFTKYVVSLILDILLDSLDPCQSILMFTFHIETSHLFCRTKYLKGFHMERNTWLQWVKWKTKKTSDFHKNINFEPNFHQPFQSV